MSNILHSVPSKTREISQSDKKTFWVYILRCENNSLYTGYTNDLNKRFNSHVNGTASKYTRAFKPICIAQSWEIKSGKSYAMHIERCIKSLSRAEKEKVINNPDSLHALFR